MLGKNLPLPAGRSVERVHHAGVGRRFDRAAIRRAKHVAFFLRSSRKSKHVLLDSRFREGGRPLGSYPETLALYRKRASGEECQSWQGSLARFRYSRLKEAAGVCGGRGPMGFESTFGCN